MDDSSRSRVSMDGLGRSSRRANGEFVVESVVGELSHTILRANCLRLGGIGRGVAAGHSRGRRRDDDSACS